MSANSKTSMRCARRWKPIAAAPSVCSHNCRYESFGSFGSVGPFGSSREPERTQLERPERVERLMLKLYNTLTRQEEAFSPSQDATVRMYACGPTVYARAHIGNFRTYVCVD